MPDLYGEQLDALADREAAIHREVLAGLPAEQGRIAECLRVLAYYNLDAGAYVPRLPGESAKAWQDRPKQTHPLTQRAVNILTSKLYSPGPSREVKDDAAADKILAEVYRDNLIDDVMQAADRMATLMGVAAIQAVKSPEGSLKPITLYVWDYSQLVVYADPADPMRVSDVVTIDRYDEQTRYRWWTDRFVRTYLTARLENGQTALGRTSRFVGHEGHDYGRLPFGFVFHQPPTSCLPPPGIGSFLADRNEAIDVKIDRMDRAVVAYHVPKAYVYNAPPNWRPDGRDAGGHPFDIGDMIRVPPAPATEAGAKEVRIEYPQPDLDIESGWLDVRETVDTAMEGLGIPSTLYRMSQDHVASGDALEAEQRPLRDYTERRQESFRRYETDTAEAILAVVGVEYDSGAATEAGSRGLNLTVRWPPQEPSLERMQTDQMAIQMETKSLAMVVQEQMRLSTADEAWDVLRRVAKDNKRLAKLGLGPEAAADRHVERQRQLMAEEDPDQDAPDPKEESDG